LGAEENKKGEKNVIKSDGRSWGQYRAYKAGTLSTIEIAKIMGVTQQYVHLLLQSGIRKIRAELKKQGVYEELEIEFK